MTASTGWFGPFLAFLSSVTWAIGSTNYSKLSRDFRPVDVNFSRAVFALPLFIVAVFVSSGGFDQGIAAFQTLGPRQFLWFSVSMLSSYALGDVLFMLSTIALGVPGALAIGSGYPILTALAGVVFEGQKLSTPQGLGLALAVGGIIAVILNDPKRTDGKTKDTEEGSEVRAHPLLKRKSVGVLLAFGTAIAWAANSYSVAKGGIGLNPAVGNSLRMIVAVVMITGVSLVMSRRPARLLNKATMRQYAWVFIAETFFGSYFFMYGLSNSSLVLASTLSSLAPVIAVPVAIALKLEKFSWIRSLAVLTVVVGLSLIFN